MKLLKFRGKSYTSHCRNEFVYMLCGRVNLCVNGMNIIGEIIDEDDDNLMIRVDNETRGHDKLMVQRPPFNCDNGCFTYLLPTISDS